MVSRAPALPGARTLDDMTEQANTPELLLRRVARGDEQAFAAVYDLVAGPVLGIVDAVLRDHAQSEAVAREVLLEIWLEAAQFDEHGRSAVAWVLTIAHRRAADRVRYQRANAERDNRAVQLESHHDEVATEHAALRQSLDELTDLQRRSIILAYYGGRTYREVSEALDEPVGTIKTLMREGLLRLRNSSGALVTTSDPHTRTGAYVLDALSPTERAVFEQHLTECARCRTEIDELSEVALELAVAVPPLPSAELKDQVLADIRVRPQRRGHALGQTQLLPAVDALGRTDIMPALNGLSDNDIPPRGRQWIIRAAIGLAAAITLVAVLITGLSLIRGERGGEAVAADQVRDAVTWNGELTTGDGTATAVVSAGVGKVVVTATGLPTPDDRHGYQLWTIPAGGTPRSAGMMHVSGDRAELATDLTGDATLLAITAEPSNGSVQPTTPIVARIPLS
ncbi:sigma-70 family RNA polymerase sigma factor [Nocardia sp. NPDC006044]|uniref:anti-sigma factor n=1 Tax=Nocardia sp. NPDC006044 TaxID=3364306 RepID=UPI0036CCF6AF